MLISKASIKARQYLSTFHYVQIAIFVCFILKILKIYVTKAVKFVQNIKDNIRDLDKFQNLMYV